MNLDGCTVFPQSVLELKVLEFLDVSSTFAAAERTENVSIPKNPIPHHLVTPQNLFFCLGEGELKTALTHLKKLFFYAWKESMSRKRRTVFFSALPCLKCSVSVKQSC